MFSSRGTVSSAHTIVLVDLEKTITSGLKVVSTPVQTGKTNLFGMPSTSRTQSRALFRREFFEGGFCTGRLRPPSEAETKDELM
jgi:hypothetical protein